MIVVPRLVLVNRVVGARTRPGSPDARRNTDPTGRAARPDRRGRSSAPSMTLTSPSEGVPTIDSDRVRAWRPPGRPPASGPSASSRPMPWGRKPSGAATAGSQRAVSVRSDTSTASLPRRCRQAVISARQPDNCCGNRPITSRRTCCTRSTASGGHAERIATCEHEGDALRRGGWGMAACLRLRPYTQCGLARCRRQVGRQLGRTVRHRRVRAPRLTYPRTAPRVRHMAAIWQSASLMGLPARRRCEAIPA